MSNAVRAYDFPAILDAAPGGVRYLSLDCFDTLLWRNVQAPSDVFADLPITGGGVRFRTLAEGNARIDQKFAKGYNEVPLEHIYARLYPCASEQDIAAAVEAEIDAEARHCFAFAPTVRLMEDAVARGLKIIVVSDTYFSEPQLRALIRRAAGQEVEAMIDRIFCSSEYGRGKSEGLFEPVLKALKAPATAILHLGDNINADQAAPAKLGIHAVHFQQFDRDAAARLRLEAAAGIVIDPKIRETLPAYQPHRPLISLSREKEPGRILGHDVVGPIMHAFASWVHDEAAALERDTGKAPRILFLMRDGHLPLQVYNTLFGEAGAAVEISRFTAIAASLTDADAIAAYLRSMQNTDRTDIIGQQLLLTPDEIHRASRQFGVAPSNALRQAVLKPDMVQKICDRSRAFADRLIRHLHREAGVEAGDTLLLVDLGYAGTVQNHIEPILRHRLSATVAGRYLLLREEDQRGLDKKGMIDCRHYDLRAVSALSGPISILEQLCTIEQGSVIDYDEEGQAMRKDAGVKGGQSITRAAVQDACLLFAREAQQGWLSAPLSYHEECRRTMTAGILGRLLFLPTRLELDVFAEFHHDINMGTQDLVKLLDVEEAGTALRRRGLSYLNDAMRMYLPGELQPHGLPLNLALFNTVRFALDIRSSDFDVGGVALSVLIADAKSQAIVNAEAYPTHDGYYHLRIPVGQARFSVGIQIGQACEWMQVESIAFLEEEAFGQILPGMMPEPIPVEPVYDGMEEVAEGLFRCAPNALLFVTPPPSDTDLVLSVSFRPLKWKGRTALRVAA